MEVLKVLKSKNLCLNNLLTECTKFLNSAQNGDLSCLDDFQKKRASTIKALDLYDRKINELIEKLPAADRTPELQQAIKQTQSLKDQLTHSIITLDEEIISLIKEERNRLLKELTSVDRSSQMVKKFKSKWIPESGEKLDGKI